MSEPARFLQSAADTIEGLLISRAPVPQGMTALLDWCEAQYPHPEWAAFRELDYSAEAARLREWVVALLAAEPLPGPETALYFGLFNPVRDDVVHADVYLAGGDRSESDWVYDVAEHWWPAGRYSDSPLLGRLYSLAYRPSGLGNAAEYPLALGFTALAVAALARDVPGALLAGGSAERWLAVGFDSGDTLEIGAVDAAGLHVSTTWI